MLAVVSPGQGAQVPGFLQPWLELDGARDSLELWSDLLGIDLIAAGTTWSAERIRDTAVAQPLLTAAALVSGRALLTECQPDFLCGHSVGEIPVLALAGVISSDDAMRLSAVRGLAMADATRQRPTGMVAVLGGARDDVARAAHVAGLQVATVNADGQVVVGGDIAALEALHEHLPSGARVRRLEVAGAFHTSAMASAARPFADALARLDPADPSLRVVANADGAVLPDGRRLLSRLLVQLTAPVRFDLCLQTLGAAPVRVVVELAPAGTLTALVQRTLPDVSRVALRTPADLALARDLLAAEAS